MADVLVPALVPLVGGVDEVKEGLLYIALRSNIDVWT